MFSGKLSVNELVMLLALDDEDGKVRWSVSPYLDYALAGGMLAELALRDIIGVSEEGGLTLKDDPQETGSGLLDEILDWFKKSDHPHTIHGWVTAVSTLSELDRRQMEELVAKGVLEKKEGYFLLIFPTTVYPMPDTTPEKEVIAKIREAVLGDAPVPRRLAVLITIAHSAHLLKGLLSSEEMESREARLYQISRGDAIAEATCELIQQAERALHIATSIPFMGISRF